MSEEFPISSKTVPPASSAPSNPPDDEAAAARFAAYTARLAALVQSRLSPRYRSRLDADDVVASAWRSFLTGVREARWNLASPDLWPLLATLVTRKLHKQIRRHQEPRRTVAREDQFDPAELRGDAPTAEEAQAATEALEAALDELDPLDREVILLRLRGDTPAEIAASTGASERSTSRAFAAACGSLRQHAGLDEHELLHVDLDAILHTPGPADSRLAAEWTVAGLPQLPYAELKLTRLVGQGGIGRVYRAVDRRSGNSLAVKFLKKRFWKQVVALQSLATELETISRINHPGVVRSLGWGRTPSGTPFIASELIEGETLSDWSGSPAATLTAKMSRLADLADSLAAVHAGGIVHGDLTPTNVVCQQSGRTVLVDFGLSTSLTAPAVSRIGATLACAAPEQVLPAPGAIGPWTDIYGFGATAFTVLTGRPLHTGSTRAAIIASIISDEPSPANKAALASLLPPDLAGLLSRSTAPCPDDRPRSLAALSRELRRAILGRDQ